MQRKILALVLGTVAAVVVGIAVTSLGHTVYPVPTDIDFKDAAAMQAYMSGLPIGALLFVLAAWPLATLGGGLLACAIARKRPLIHSAIIGGLVLLGTVINLRSIPHPTWFSVTSIVAIIATIFITARLGSAFVVMPEVE